MPLMQEAICEAARRPSMRFRSGQDQVNGIVFWAAISRSVSALSASTLFAGT
jgi:hypothetical protein